MLQRVVACCLSMPLLESFQAKKKLREIGTAVSMPSYTLIGVNNYGT